MRSNSSLAWTRFHDVLLVAQRPGTPTDADWSDYGKDAGSAPFKGALVVGEGNKLSAIQRLEVGRWLKRNGARNAVVTNSAVSRAVLIALGWFGVPVKAFAPSDMMGAPEFLGLPFAGRDLSRLRNTATSAAARRSGVRCTRRRILRTRIRKTCRGFRSRR